MPYNIALSRSHTQKIASIMYSLQFRSRRPRRSTLPSHQRSSRVYRQSRRFQAVLEWWALVMTCYKWASCVTSVLHVFMCYVLQVQAWCVIQHEIGALGYLKTHWVRFAHVTCHRKCCFSIGAMERNDPFVCSWSNFTRCSDGESTILLESENDFSDMHEYAKELGKM